MLHTLQRELDQVRLAGRIRHHARRMAAQAFPIAVLDDGVQEREVLADELDVRALAALEERFK